ncbi:MAG: hypothetical protein RLZZ479_902 [Bacteroidota bacterium]|jgi:hypothetical protein
MSQKNKKSIPLLRFQKMGEDAKLADEPRVPILNAKFKEAVFSEGVEFVAACKAWMNGWDQKNIQLANAKLNTSL